MSAILAEYTSVFVLRRFPPAAVLRASDGVRRCARPAEAGVIPLTTAARVAAVRYLEARARRMSAPAPAAADQMALCEPFAEMHVAMMRMVGWIMVMVDDPRRRAALMAPVHEQARAAVAARRRRGPEASRRPQGWRPTAEPALPHGPAGPATLLEIPAMVPDDHGRTSVVPRIARRDRGPDRQP